MTRLVLLSADNTDRQYPVGDREIVIGRANGLPVVLEGANVSRRHARIWREGGACFVEDLGSSNGTCVNDRRIAGKTRMHAGDLLRIGSHTLRFEDDFVSEVDMTIMLQTAAATTNADLFRESPERKLRAVLELSHHLAQSLDTDALLALLLDHLLLLFPQTDRVLAIFPRDGEAVVRAARERHPASGGALGFSRSIARKVLDNGMAVLAEDTRNLELNASIGALGIRSLMTVPLQTRNGRVVGALELDRFQFGRPFAKEDLHLLTAIALQASTALENASLHQELLVKERMQRELALAREIQEGFLPRETPRLAEGAVELWGELQPAQEIAGDFYDYLALDDRRLALVVGDVSGKGMPAALFLATVRALLRDLIQRESRLTVILSRLNDAIARDNPKFMFVTLLLGIYDPATGRCLLARAGHPPAILRRHSGVSEEIDCPVGKLIGIDTLYPIQEDTVVNLQPGDTLVFYTDGLTEAVEASSQAMYGIHRLLQSLGKLHPTDPLREWSRLIRGEVEKFARSTHLSDDLTLLLLRRPVPA